MSVHLESWGVDDLSLVEKTVGDAEMMKYLGGAESPEQLSERHVRYLNLQDTGTALLEVCQARRFEGIRLVHRAPSIDIDSKAIISRRCQMCRRSIPLIG
jgi:hypothetical protein